jgi:hypothetical protein
VDEVCRKAVVRTEAQKAAWDNGFRLDRGAEGGCWKSVRGKVEW